MSDIDIQDPNEAIRELLMRIAELEAENAKLRMAEAEAMALVINHEGRIERLTEDALK
jgi:hypothetical protein